MAVHITPKKALAQFEKAKTAMRRGHGCQLPAEVELKAAGILREIDSLIDMANMKNGNYREIMAGIE